MPTIPKYNQRSTSDLNYAKRRVVEAEKEGIAKLLNRSAVEYEDANKIAELLVKSMEDLVVLIQRLTGFIEIGEGLSGDLDLDLELNLTSWDLVDRNNYPRVVGLIVATNLSLKRILGLAKQFQKVFNFATPLNIQKIKDMYDSFIDYLNIYHSVSSQLLLSYKDIRNEINEDDVRSVISDLSDDLSENASQFDIYNPDNWFDDRTRGFIEYGIDLLQDYINPDDDDESDFQTAPSGSSSRSSNSKKKKPKPRITLEQFNEKNFKRILREIGKNIQTLPRIFEYIFDNYNEARVQPEQTLAERKKIISEEYVGSGKTYSVGNKYAEQLYNTSGMYH